MELHICNYKKSALGGTELVSLPCNISDYAGAGE